MHVDCSINTSYDISAVWEIIAQGRIMTLITPFKPFKHTLLVNTLHVKGHFVFFKKKTKKLCGGRNTYGLYRLNRILTNYYSNITEF